MGKLGVASLGLRGGLIGGDGDITNIFFELPVEGYYVNELEYEGTYQNELLYGGWYEVEQDQAVFGDYEELQYEGEYMKELEYEGEYDV